MVYSGWKNKVGTADRACKCGSWKNHWIKFSDKAWPAKCSVEVKCYTNVVTEVANKI